MSLTLTKVPDCEQNAGVSQVEVVYQAQPATADYPSGGYVIPGALTTSTTCIGNFGAEFTYCVDVQGGNAAAAQYVPLFVFPSGSFGTTPAPATSVTMLVAPVGVGAGSPLGLGAVSSAKSTTIGVTGSPTSLVTVAIANSLKAGQFVYLNNFTAGGALNGSIVQVVSATSTGFTAYAPGAANITAATADTTGTYQLIQAGTGNNLTTGTAATITNSAATSASPSVMTITCANTFSPGQFVVLQGLTTNTALNGVIAQILTSSTSQFTAQWYYTGSALTSAADTGTASLLVTAGNAPVTAQLATGTSTLSASTASSAGTAGIVTLTAPNSLNVGNIFVLSDVGGQLAIQSGSTFVVSSITTLNSVFVANHLATTIGSAADVHVVASLLVTGTPTTTPQVAVGTDLSGCTWFLDFLNSGI
jgi:hypothetical protein